MAFGMGLPLVAAFGAVPDTSRGDRMLADYFRQQTAKLADRCLSDVQTLKDWTSRRAEYRRQLLEMLGLDPLPRRTELKAVVTGAVDQETFKVEKVQFQSRPGLYVTGDLYLPKKIDHPCPTILYVCGHGRVKIDGVSYGNKVHYQHHGAWFARHGYVCLTIDTLQLGEIEGVHHGTYSKGRWWWNSRGYTPAGVEAWNCVRALDYLETRPEVDAKRFGVTGRSGGGAYSWWLAAIDSRIKVAVPVAGITDLENHVVDGCVEGHCDCMYMVNTYGWDFAQVAALVAPRPLLIENSDKDSIFPLDGVVRLHAKVRRIYALYDAEDRLGLYITEGPHQDTQQLRIGAFHWFDRFLKNDESLIDRPATKFFEPAQLKVFDTLPADEQNSRIDETFTRRASVPPVPLTADHWSALRDGWMKNLREKSLRGWPERGEPLRLQKALSSASDGLALDGYDFNSQGPIRLRLYTLGRAGLKRPKLVVLNVLDAKAWREWRSAMEAGFAETLSGDAPILADDGSVQTDADRFAQLGRMLRAEPWVMAYVAPRGIGPTVWTTNAKKRVQIRRRFMLLGQTLDGMRAWDIRRAIAALRTVGPLGDVPLWLEANRQMAGVTLYASLFEPNIERLDLWQLPASHRQGPTLLNVLRYLDMPQAVAMAAERSRVRLYDVAPQSWQFPLEVAQQLGWPEGRVEIVSLPTADKATE